MPRFQRASDPDRPGQLLLDAGAPVAIVYWAHDYSERDQTGWFMALLDDDGEPFGGPPRRLAVSDDVAHLVRDDRLARAAWVARAETLELVTSGDAVEAGEQELNRIFGSPPA